MTNSLIGSLLLLGFATYLMIRLSKKADSDRYKLKPKNKWNSLSEGIDPTDE